MASTIRIFGIASIRSTVSDLYDAIDLLTSGTEALLSQEDPEGPAKSLGSFAVGDIVSLTCLSFSPYSW